MANYNLFDAASLAMVPVGYKAGKLYSVKPDTGAGDFDFSRASSATRVNADGLIEKERGNQILQSNQFDTTWTQQNTTLTSGQTGYDGSNDAWKVEAATTSTTRLYQNSSIFPAIAANTLVTISLYAKVGNVDFIKFNLATSGTNSIVTFDLTDGTTYSSNAIDTTWESVGSGWVRISAAFLNSDAITEPRIEVRSNYNSASCDAGSFVYIQDAQIETGDVATDYIETTTAAVSVGPVANVPRINFDPILPRTGSLLLEPQRTNLITYSESFDNAAWAKTAASVTANAVTSPTGYQDADTLTADGTNSTHRVGVALVLGAGKTLSVFAKAGTNNFVQFYTDYTNNDYANFDLANGVVGTKGPDATASIEDYGNGWYRCIMTTGNAASQNFVINIVSSASAARAQSTTLTTTVHLFGAQIETGAYATSYIPTYGAAATRGADAASKTGISSLIGQSEGTLFLDFTPQSKDFQIYYQVRTTGSTNVGQIDIRYQSSNLRALGTDGGASQFSIIAGDIVVGQRYKCAVRYKLNDVAFYVNGALAGTDTSATFASSALQQLSFNENAGSFSPQAEIHQALLFQTRFTNDQLSQITTL